MNTRPAAESHPVDLTPQGLRRVRAWGALHHPRKFPVWALSGAGLSASNAIFIGTVDVAVTFASIALIDRVGRCPLLLGSFAGMAVPIVPLGLAFAVGMSPLDARVHDVVHRGVRVGMGPVFWVLLGEVFPSA